MRQLVRKAIFVGFCKTKFKQTMLQALWAQVTMNQILNPKCSELEQPLVDYLRAMELPQNYKKILIGQNDYQCSPQEIKNSRKQFMQAFSPFGGAQLPELLINAQYRFVKSAKDNNKKFSFYPNTIVTTQIFQIMQSNLHKPKTASIIVLGKPGISKSVAFLFYWYLSFLRIRFRYQCQQKQVKQLVQASIINKLAYKILYINFDPLVNTQKQIIKLLQSQCPQIQKQLQFTVNQKTSFRKVLQEIINAYEKKQIRCFLIADQINAVARQFKEYNEVRIKIQKNINVSAYQDIESRANFLLKLNNAIMSTIPHIYNSSSNIQRELLGRQNDQNGLFCTLNMLNHNQAQFYPVGFKTGLTETQIKQTLRFIWYSVAQRMPTLCKDSKIQEMFVKVCDKVAKEKGMNSFLTPLSIFEAVKDCQLKEFQLDNEAGIENFVINICQKEVVNNLKSKSLLFLRDNNIATRMKKARVAIQLINYLKKNQNKTSVPKTMLVSAFEDFIDKDIFKDSKDQLEFQLTIRRDEFFLLAEEWIKFISKDTQLFKAYQIHIKAHPGQAIELALIQLLKTDDIGFLNFGNHQYTYKKVMNFNNLLKQKQNMFINFVELYKEANKLEKDIMGLNVSVCGLPNSRNNPTFDFMFMTKTKDELIQATSIDLTITAQKQNIEKKVSKASKFFEALDNDIYFPRDDPALNSFVGKVISALNYSKDSKDLLENCMTIIIQKKESLKQKFNLQATQFENKIKAIAKRENVVFKDDYKVDEDIIINIQLQELKKQILDFMKVQKLVYSTKENFGKLVKWNHIVAYLGVKKPEKFKEKKISQKRLTEGEHEIELSIQTKQIQRIVVHNQSINSQSSIHQQKIIQIALKQAILMKQKNYKKQKEQ